MKYVLLSALCLAFSGCANTSNGGGWVVGNGMTDQDTAQDGMNSFGSSHQDSVGKPAGCVCEEGQTACNCEQPAKKRKHKR